MFHYDHDAEGSHLPLTEVLDHMKTAMEKHGMREWAAMEYTHIFLTDILSVSCYVIAISASKWEGKKIDSCGCHKNLAFYFLF